MKERLIQEAINLVSRVLASAIGGLIVFCLMRR